MMHQRKWLASSSPAVVNEKFVSNRSNSYRATGHSHFIFVFWFSFRPFFVAEKCFGFRFNKLEVLICNNVALSHIQCEHNRTTSDKKNMRKVIGRGYSKNTYIHLWDTTQLCSTHRNDASSTQANIHTKATTFLSIYFDFCCCLFFFFQKKSFWYLKLHMGLGVNCVLYVWLHLLFQKFNAVTDAHTFTAYTCPIYLAIVLLWIYMILTYIEPNVMWYTITTFLHIFYNY